MQCCYQNWMEAFVSRPQQPASGIPPARPSRLHRNGLSKVQSLFESTAVSNMMSTIPATQAETVWHSRFSCSVLGSGVRGLSEQSCWGVTEAEGGAACPLGTPLTNTQRLLYFYLFVSSKKTCRISMLPWTENRTPSLRCFQHGGRGRRWEEGWGGSSSPSREDSGMLL